jgi:hypothetical protein
MEFLSGVVAYVCYGILLFTAGALVGKPLYNWLATKLPWGK